MSACACKHTYTPGTHTHNTRPNPYHLQGVHEEPALACISCIIRGAIVLGSCTPGLIALGVCTPDLVLLPFYSTPLAHRRPASWFLSSIVTILFSLIPTQIRTKSSGTQAGHLQILVSLSHYHIIVNKSIKIFKINPTQSQ